MATAENDNVLEEAAIGLFKFTVGLVVLMIGGIAALFKFQHDRQKDGEAPNLLEMSKDGVTTSRTTNNIKVVVGVLCLCVGILLCIGATAYPANIPWLVAGVFVSCLGLLLIVSGDTAAVPNTSVARTLEPSNSSAPASVFTYVIILRRQTVSGSVLNSPKRSE